MVRRVGARKQATPSRAGLAFPGGFGLIVDRVYRVYRAYRAYRVYRDEARWATV